MFPLHEEEVPLYCYKECFIFVESGLTKCQQATSGDSGVVTFHQSNVFKVIDRSSTLQEQIASKTDFNGKLCGVHIFIGVYVVSTLCVCCVCYEYVCVYV